MQNREHTFCFFDLNMNHGITFSLITYHDYFIMPITDHGYSFGLITHHVKILTPITDRDKPLCHPV